MVSEDGLTGETAVTSGGGVEVSLELLQAGGPVVMLQKVRRPWTKATSSVLAIVIQGPVMERPQRRQNLCEQDVDPVRRVLLDHLIPCSVQQRLPGLVLGVLIRRWAGNGVKAVLSVTFPFQAVALTH